jgi:hypothetical protein
MPVPDKYGYRLSNSDTSRSFSGIDLMVPNAAMNPAFARTKGAPGACSTVTLRRLASGDAVAVAELQPHAVFETRSSNSRSDVRPPMHPPAGRHPRGVGTDLPFAYRRTYRCASDASRVQRLRRSTSASCHISVIDSGRVQPIATERADWTRGRRANRPLISSGLFGQKQSRHKTLCRFMSMGTAGLEPATSRM